MNRIRSIGIVAHVDAGKTTLTEQILYQSGKVRKLGSVDQGSSNMDWQELERERGITVYTEQAEIDWKGNKINLIDTPGHADFVAELDRALAVLDGAVLVISAVEGVQSHTEVIWDQLQKRKIPTLIFVNKLDRARADPLRVYREIRERLTANIVPLQFAPQLEKDFREIIDVLQGKRYVWNEDYSIMVENCFDEYTDEQFHRARQELIGQIGGS